MKKVAVFLALAFGTVVASSALADTDARATSQVYNVRRGDRLAEVAARYGLTQEEILAANPRTAYGVACGDPLTVVLADGQKRAICGRPRFYLIAGKTLVIPASRLSTETENVRLGAEVAALQSEMAKLRQERETEKSELATLAKECDNLRDKNEDLTATKAELQGEYDEAQIVNQQIRSDYRNAQANSSDNKVTILAVVGFCLTVILIFAFYYSPNRASKRRAEQARRNLDRLATEQQALARDREELRKQRQEVERAAQEVAAKQAAIAKDRETIVVESRANNSYKADLDVRDASLKARADELDQRSQELREKNRALNGRDADLYLREENLAAGERLLEDGRKALRQDRQQLHNDEKALEAKRAEVDAKLRTAEEDLPVLEKQKGEVTQRVSAVRVREIDATRREEDVGRREVAAAARENELERRKAAVGDEELILAKKMEAVDQHEKRLGEIEASLIGKQDALQTKEDELARLKAEFEEQRTAAEELIRVAGGLEDAQNILKRAKRKAEIVKRLEAREDAVAERERIVQRDEERGRALEGLPRSRQPRRMTLPPPPVALPPVGDASEGHGDVGDDDLPTVVLPQPPEGDVDPSAITHVTAPGSEPAMDVSKCLCPICGNEVQFGKLEEHIAQAHPESIVSHDAGQTGPQIPIADKPSHEESGMYCARCKKLVTPEQYAANHAAHDEGLPKPHE
jgi:LysM repeat protein